MPSDLTLAASDVSRQTLRKVSQMVAKFITTETRLLSKTALEMLPKHLAHAVGQPQSTSLGGLGLVNVMIGTSMDLFLAQFCAHVNSFVRHLA